jgi:hypothetical protein
MTQSRLGSFIEAMVNIVIGYTINFIANLFIFPHFGWEITVKQNIILGVIYTVISVTRQYAIRRWFNKLLRKAIYGSTV